MARKPRCLTASRNASPRDCGTAGDCASAARASPRIPSDSSASDAATHANTAIAARQPNASMSACPIGASTIVPSEPAAATAPTVWLRRSSGVARATTPISTPNPVPAIPMPVRKPATFSPSAPLEKTIRSRPPAYTSDVATSTGRGPYRSASAPTNGWLRPQTMFCSASEKLKAAAETPRSSVIGRRNRPRLWRSPMQSEMIKPLRSRTTSIERGLGIAVIGVGGGQKQTAFIASAPGAPFPHRLSRPGCPRRAGYTFSDRPRSPP